MILIVDDDAAVREMLQRVLLAEGHSVSTAADGPRALAIADQRKIDLVLLDLNLPNQDGWDTFERLTAKHPEMAVIIITARSGQQITANCAGVGALLEKPLDFPLLLRTINDLLSETLEMRLARLTGHLGSQAPSSGPQSKRHPPKRL